MYHRRRLKHLFATTLLSLTALLGTSAAFAAIDEKAVQQVTSVTDKSDYRLVADVKDLKRRPAGVSIYQYDSSPVGNRSALLLVHGMRGEFWRNCFRWRSVCEHLKASAEFNKKYKIYLARYDSYASLKRVSPLLGEQVRTLSKNTSDRPVTIVALSMGGNLIQHAMKDPATESAVDHVITMGTPFHGSPLFTDEWMRYSLLKNTSMPLARLDAYLPYRIYFSKHKNLLTELSWDNTDKFVPNVGKFKFLFPVYLSGEVSPGADANIALKELNKSDRVVKRKFTVYGGYLASSVSDATPPNRLVTLVGTPVRLARTTIPEHCGKEHPVLRVLNRQIATAVTVPSKKTERKWNVYGLNDGITPLASSLFLPDDALPGRAFATPADVSSLGGLVDVSKARVFANIDHLTFIDGYRPRGGKKLVADQLSPAEKERHIFDWLLFDLLNGSSDRLADKEL